MVGKAQWFTPIAALKNKEEVWQSIENRGWRPVPLKLDRELTYFNNKFKEERKPEYDIYFAYTKTFPLWNERKHKENSHYLPYIRENIFEQEKYKPVPVLTSMNYGRPCRVPFDFTESSYRRKCNTEDFYRRRYDYGLPNETERTNFCS